MKCKVCRTEEATEFIGPTGLRLKYGYCEACFLRAVKTSSYKEGGRLSKADAEVRDLNRHGTDQAGRPARDVRTLAYQYPTEEEE